MVVVGEAVVVPRRRRRQIVWRRVAGSQGSQVVGVVPGLPPVSLLSVTVVLLQSQYVSPQLRLRELLVLPWEEEEVDLVCPRDIWGI